DRVERSPADIGRAIDAADLAAALTLFALDGIRHVAFGFAAARGLVGLALLGLARRFGDVDRALRRSAVALVRRRALVGLLRPRRLRACAARRAERRRRDEHGGDNDTRTQAHD